MTSNNLPLIFPAIILAIVGIFVFSPLGMGWNPLNGTPVIVTEHYNIEPITVEGKYFSASDNDYNIICNNNIMYSTSNIVYTNLTVNKSYLVALRAVNATLNMDGAFWRTPTKSVITTTIDHIVEEVK